LAYRYRIGADENGLGARLGPMVVTAVLAETDTEGQKFLQKKLPKRLRADLDDSKRLVSHTDVTLGEAWARALAPREIATPSALFASISLDPPAALREPCPRHVEGQCWRTDGEAFQAEPELIERLRGHRALFESRGVRLLEVKTSVHCTKRLNQQRAGGINRFVLDLHAMEALIIALRRRAGADVHAVCGKVGGMGGYSKFFGPLAGLLHAVLEEGRRSSGYRFPGLGELYFVRDADARDPLVMLASLVGKYVRELFMRRIASHYGQGYSGSRPSGYHDPVSDVFVRATALVRRKSRIPDDCFERARDA
jgi:ribonuclease HII